MILLVVALVSLTAASRRGLGWRDAALRGAVLFGLATTFITENLSLLGDLRGTTVAGAWALVIVAASAVALGKAPSEKRSLPAIRQVWFEALVLAGIAVLAGLVGVTALVSAPNSADAMAYHLPRIVYWVQQASVASFPTHYLNQVMLQPFGEYVTLQTWLLSGGDAYANLPQFGAYLLCIAGVSLIARELGGSRRAQALSAAACATLPNVILQASGAKNDLVLAGALTAFVYFGLRFACHSARAELAFAASAAALAVSTKGTAYLFLPPLGLTLLFISRSGRVVAARDLILAGAAATLLVNGPLYIRNFRLSGSPLGFDSAHGDGFFRWQNEPISLPGAASNILRHATEQLGARDESWNRAIFHSALSAHKLIGLDPNDPATTWRWSKFEAPRNANHEANRNNRIHLIWYALALVWAVWVSRKRAELRPVAALGAALVAGFFLFCLYLKWQPFQTRMFAPLYVLAAPIGGLALAATPPWIQLAVCALFFDGSRLPATENWSRPLEGERSIFKIRREDGYLADLTPWENHRAYVQAADWIVSSGCLDVGLDLTEHQIEYPIIAFVSQRQPAARFRHINVRNPSSVYGDEQAPTPCAVVCMECAGHADKITLYRDYTPPLEKDGFLVFLKDRSD